MDEKLFPDLAKIHEAHVRIRDHIHRTPVLQSENLNTIFGTRLFFKCENLQKAGAFKSRGAVNAVMSLPQQAGHKGVATHSSGNHAQALARAAALRNFPAYIVMPSNSSIVKVNAVKAYGGHITFCEPTLEARESTLANVISITEATEIHPYNSIIIIAGQATATKELIEEIGILDIILAPVGGGGLLSGTALAAKYLLPGCKVIASEPEGANDAWQSFRKKMFVPSINPNTIADGLLTSLGSITFPIIMKHVHDVVTVSEEGIIKAMKLVWERMKIIIEPSAAVPLAALMENKVAVAGKKVGIILSGGNVDLQSLPWDASSK